MEKVEEVDLKLMADFLRREFPKRRVKVTPNSRFEPGIVIPACYLNSDAKSFSLKRDYPNKMMRKMLHIILYKFFSFEDDLINQAIDNYLGPF